MDVVDRVLADARIEQFLGRDAGSLRYGGSYPLDGGWHAEVVLVRVDPKWCRRHTTLRVTDECRQLVSSFTVVGDCGMELPAWVEKDAAWE